MQFVSINAESASSAADQKKLTDRCSFPLLQNMPGINTWSLHHQGGKDDMFIYTPEGKLAYYLPVSGEVSVNLSTEEGYANLKAAILDVAGAE